MDPLTALSLAANVIAIVDISAKLVNTTLQVARAGAKAGHIEIEDHTRLVQSHLVRLKPGLNAESAGLSQDDQELVKLCDQSRDVSEQLIRMLQSCKSDGGTGKISLEAFVCAVKSEWKDDAIKDLSARLESIETRVHQLLTCHYQTKIFVKMESLERTFKSLGTSRAVELEDIQKAIKDLGSSGSLHGGVSSQLIIRAAEKGGLAKDLAFQAGILEQLRFDEIDRRLQELERRPSHKRSYLWLEGSSNNADRVGRDPSNFETWLASPEKMYWISGVPGSGKSTLMKYLYSSNRTKELLASWTRGGRLLVAAYFFWEVGKTSMLRTQVGLLRTLLFQILRQCPELISEVYADLWTLSGEATSTSQDSLSAFAGSQVPLSVGHLLGKMKECCRYIADRGYRLFLVIDGLDEYGGRPADIIELMSALNKLPSVKICVSSRPDNAFMDAYGVMTTRLFMERFNKADIAGFVRDRFESHALFKQDEDRNTLGAHLIHQVVNDSNGVFLWVRLVVDDLEEGLTDRNTIVQLQRRLDSLPTELESFYDHMLDRVDKRYREDAASMLLTAYHAHDLLSPLAFWFASERSRELEEDGQTKPTDSRTNNRRRGEMEFRLRSYSRGLLVIQELPLTSPRLIALPSSSLFGQKVNFLHRTIREFLVRDHVIQRLDDWLSSDLDIDELICKATRAEIRGSPNDTGYFARDGPISGLISIFDSHCAKLHTKPSRSADASMLQDSLAKILSIQKKVNGHTLMLAPLVSDQNQPQAPPDSNSRGTKAGASRSTRSSISMPRKERFNWRLMFQSS